MASDAGATGSRAHAGEDGNTLLLMPVGVLILLVLGAIAVDFAVVFMAEREVINLSAGIANDAAGALDEEGFFGDDAVTIDEERAETIVASVTAARPGDTVDPTCAVTDAGGTEVEVTCSGEVDLIFSPAIPGGASTFSVEGSSVAEAALE